VAAFGLSAFFFSTMAGIFFHGDTGSLLRLLALGTCVMVSVSGFFLRVLPPTQKYTTIPDRETEDRQQFTYEEPEEIGRQDTNSIPSSSQSSSTQPLLHAGREPISGNEALNDLEDSRVTGEATSLVDAPKTSPYTDEETGSQVQTYHDNENSSHYSDIRGLALIRRQEFWQLFLMMGLLSGIGLMTIKWVLRS
jgi:hypothetical protein